MSTANALGDLLSTLLLRRPFQRGGSKEGSISKLCLSLLSEVTEVSGRTLQLLLIAKRDITSILNLLCYHLFGRDAEEVRWIVNLLTRSL